MFNDGVGGMVNDVEKLLANNNEDVSFFRTNCKARIQSDVLVAQAETVMDVAKMLLEMYATVW